MRLDFDLISSRISFKEPRAFIRFLTKAGLNPNGYRPATWAQWMKDLAAIKRAGTTPFCSDYVPLQW